MRLTCLAQEHITLSGQGSIPDLLFPHTAHFITFKLPCLTLGIQEMNWYSDHILKSYQIVSQILPVSILGIMHREQYGEYAFLCQSVKGLQVFSLPAMYTFIYFDEIHTVLNKFFA